MVIPPTNNQDKQKDESLNNHNINKDNITYKIITDDPAKDASDFRNYSERLSQIIVKSIPQFTVGIFGGWGTGKTTMMQMIKDKIDKNYSDVATTIWFDAWKYENEEFSALVPLVRTIILHLEEYVTKSDQSAQKIAIKNLIKNFKKMGGSIIRNSKPTVGVENFGARVSVETDINKVLNEYKSEGSFFLGQHEIRFYKHISERIGDELKKIRENDGIKKGKIGENVELEETRKFKIVIFIDDLDRCTPDRALEILESIKTFFDIEGIIYVIGMDPATIDPIIHSKYGENSKINGLDYLQKIVQLPFQIPLWSDNDLTETIKEMIKRTGLPKTVTEKLLKKEIKNLIIKSAKLNPRNIKRFINSLVLSYDIDDQNLKNYIIENYLKSMISIQTFYFRGEKWLQFVKMIMNYNDRIQFLKHFITFIKSENISYQDLEDKVKHISTLKYLKQNKKILEIYNKIIEINDEDLFTFLIQAAEPLLRIGKIENYLRAVDTKQDIDTTKYILDIKSYESINKLQHGIQEFNDYVQNSNLHLPYLPYFELKLDKDNKLQKILLSQSFLFKADFAGANLSNVKFAFTDLSHANLSIANLSNADLFYADLSDADLSEANLSGADLSDADLSEANLSGADLSHVNLSRANLIDADLSEANLSGADLSYANLSSVNLSEANLVRADLSHADLSHANLSYANLSRASLSRVDLMNLNLSNSILINTQNYESSKLNNKTNFSNAISNDINLIYHISNFTMNIPEIVNNQKELKLKLE